MKNQKRKTGFKFLKDCDWGTHLCLLYRSKEELKKILVPYFKAGLENNEFCLWITSEVVNRAEVIETMKTEVTNFEQYLNGGQMEIVPYTEWYLKKGKFDWQRVIDDLLSILIEAGENGYNGIRISGDTSFLESTSYDAFSEYESQINRIIDNYNILAICSYPVDTLDISEIVDIVDNHRYSIVKQNEKWRVIRSNTLQQKSDELRNTRVRFEVLQQITEDIHGSLDLSDILQRITDICVNSLGYTTAFIMTVDKSERLFRLKYLTVKKRLLSLINKTLGFPLRELTAPVDAEYNQSFRSVLGGEMVIADRLSTIAYPLLGKKTCSALQKLAGTSSYIVLPVIIDNSVGGVVFISSKAETITEEELQTIRYLSRSASIALKNASHYTEISNARESIQKSEGLFRSIAETSPDYIVQTDNQGKITYASPAVKNIIGYEPDELIAESYLDLIPKSSQSKAKNMLERLRAVKQLGHVEIEILHKDGRAIPVEISGALITQDEKADGMLAIIRDITERKRSEDILKRRLDFEKTIATISSRFLNIGDDIDDAINLSLEDMGRVSQADRAYLFLFNKDCTFMDNTHEWCAAGVMPQIENLKRLPCESFPWWMTKLRKGKYIYIKDVSEMPVEADAEREMLESQDIKSVLVFPVYTGEQLTGFIGIDDADATEEWNSEDIDILRISADIIGRALEREQVEKDLRTSEEKYEYIVEKSNDGIVIMQDGELKFANGVTELMTGYKREEVIGQPFLDFIAAEDRDLVLERYRSRIQGEHIPSRYEIRLLKKDGSKMHVEINASLIEYEGKLADMALIRDITDRKLMEEELRESEIFRSSLLNNAPNPINVINPDTSIRFINPALEKLTGYPAEELIGKKAPYPFWGELTGEKYLSRLEEAMRHGMEDYERQFTRKNGEKFWVKITNMPVNKGDEMDYLLASWIDITESKKAEEALRESEEKYRNLVQNAPIGITISATDGKIIDVNRALLEMHGYDSIEEFNRVPVNQRYHDPEDRKRWQKLVREKGIVRGFEAQLKRKDGTLFWASMSSIPQMDRNGVQQYIVVIQDITEHKREERLQQGENHILSLIGQDAELNEILDAIIRLGEESDPSIKGSVLLYNRSTGLLHYASGPNLPDNFRQQLKDGLPIGPNVGSCGTAAYLKERVIVQDIENSPLFKEHEEAVNLAINNTLFACWSQPIISTSGELLGTIANYSNTVGEPNAESIKLLEWSSRIAAIAIEHKQAEKELLLRAQLLDNASDGISLFNLDGEYIYVNGMYCKVHGIERQDLIGMNIREMDVNATDEWLERLEKELREKGIVVFESVHHRKDGSPINLEVHSTEIEVGGTWYNLSVERDITERKQSEESLRESELFNSSLLENSPNPIVVINADTSIRYMNPAMVRLTGYSFEELIGIKPPYPYWKKEEIERATARLKEDMIQGVKNHEVEFNRKNGEKFWVSINNTPIKSGDKLGYLLSTWVDITDSKKITEALKESEEKYRSLVQNTLSGVYIERKSNFVYVNPEFQKLTGYSEEELLNMKADDIVHPDDKSLVRKAAVDMLKNKLHTPYEFRIVTADGMTRWAMETVTSIIYMGEKASLGSIMDVTERKRMETALRESEEKFSEVFYASPKPMTIIAPDTGIINDVNKAFSNSSGFTREECLGKTITELRLWVSEEDRRNFLQRLSEQESIQNFETEMRIKSGEILNILLSTTMITITGKPYIIISSDDITEQKRMQENLIVTDRLASIGELAAGIAHELNNPLTGVIGFSDLLMARNDLPQDAREDLDIVSREALRASQVARHLLTFARKHPDEKKQININNVILLVLELRAYEQRVNNIEVITNLDENLPDVLANDFQLQQVFINIIINAEHFMIETNGRGRLEITTEKRGDSVITTIVDDGPGIAPEHLNRIFDPFFTTKDVGKGTGLGLSICYGIITEHGGTIRAEGEYGKGAAFIIELPVI